MTRKRHKIKQFLQIYYDVEEFIQLSKDMRKKGIKKIKKQILTDYERTGQIAVPLHDDAGLPAKEETSMSRPRLSKDLALETFLT